MHMDELSAKLRVLQDRGEPGNVGDASKPSALMWEGGVSIMLNYALSYPALAGEPVTEGHSQWCKQNGHATHTVDGVDTGLCPRCGDVKSASDLPVSVTPATSANGTTVSASTQENLVLRGTDTCATVGAYVGTTSTKIPGKSGVARSGSTW
jgi:hypothetical protein